MRSTAMLRTGVALTAMLISAAASAQTGSPLPSESVTPENQAAPSDETDRQGDIVITGSRIRHNPLDQNAPVTFVDKSDIEKTGLNSVSEVLQRLPSVGGGLNAKFNTSGNSGNPPDGAGVGAGSAEIDLRYLGSKRTLVLVDGMRFVNGASASGVPGSVDLNAIPEAMIERVEVLQDGASAIYGSDAIAGVVNIITKHAQDGFEASAQVGQYDEGDGTSQNYQLSWGNGSNSSTEVVAGAGFTKNDSVFAGDRAISAFPTPYGTTCNTSPPTCSSSTPLGRFILLQDPTLPYDEVTNPYVSVTLRGPVLNGVPVYNPADPFDPNSDYKRFASADRFNFAPSNYILTPLTRYGGFVNVRQEFNPDLHLTAKILANRRDSKNQAAPLPLVLGPGAGNGNLLDTIVIDATNPFNPFGTTLAPGQYDTFFRRMVEAGPRKFHQKVDTIYGTATFDGKFALGTGDWFWDVNGIWGHNKAKQSFAGDINAKNVQIALGPLATCQATPGCVPFNYFGGEGSITQAMLDYIGYTEHNSSKQNMWGVSANVSGKLAPLGGGDLGLAAGAEYRKLSGRFDPDPITAAGFTSDIPSQPTKGHYDVKEVYAELAAPLLEVFEVTGALRYSDYSTSGGKATYKIGANLKALPGVKLRGSYGTGFRAPSIGELFGGLTRYDAGLLDPCSASANPSAEILARCAALGVPAGYDQTNPQISVVTGGNQSLKAETSKGINVGVVWQPVNFSNRFTAEVNYYNIAIDSAIQQVDAATILDNCINRAIDSSCAVIPRTSTGQITQIQGVLQNIGGIRTSGFDVNLGLRLPPASWGTLTLTSNNTFLTKYIDKLSTGDINRRGTELGSPARGLPKVKAIQSLDWTLGQLGATVVGRYTSGLRESDRHQIQSRVYVDTQARWSPNFLSGMQIALGVNNVLDKDPPVCTSCGVPNYDPNLYDIPGRYFYGRVSVKMK
ncbi:MAG: TonB-dependent receptor [Sphingomicrobium sp.]